MAPLPKDKSLGINPEPCGSASTPGGGDVLAPTWPVFHRIREVLQEIRNITNNIETIIEQTIITVLGDTTIINIFETSQGTSAGRKIEFELLEDNDGSTPATVNATYNGDAPASPVTVLDPLGRWPDAKEGALGIAQEVYSGMSSVWLIEQCQQLVRFGTATVDEDSCGEPGPLAISNFVPIFDGEYVQDADPEPNEATNPKIYPFTAGVEVSLRRVGNEWQIESAGTVEVSQLTDVYMSGQTLMKEFTTVRAIACPGGLGGDPTEVFTAEDCEE